MPSGEGATDTDPALQKKRKVLLEKKLIAKKEEIFVPF